jgi:signal-transduction protein with cAMP-binding, CBS, and nucleotidyltransferase domain
MIIEFLMKALIEKIKLFGLDETKAIKLASIFSIETVLDKNDYFLNKNSVCTQLGFITKGMCRYYYVSENGDEVTRWVSLENEFTTSLGSFIMQSKSQENIQAIKPTTILSVEKEIWTSFYKEELIAQKFWTKAIEKYLIEIEERVYSLIALNAQSRYEILKQNYPKLVREVPDKYLASILGIKPRHLSRLRVNTK